MRWAGFVVAVLQLSVVGWMTREMFLNYGRGRTEQRRAVPIAAAALVALTIVHQVIDLARGPARTSSWVSLGFALGCIVIPGVILLLRRRRTA